MSSLTDTTHKMNVTVVTVVAEWLTVYDQNNHQDTSGNLA